MLQNKFYIKSYNQQKLAKEKLLDLSNDRMSKLKNDETTY